MRIMLLDSEEVGMYIFKKGTIFPNELFPTIPACLFRYVSQGLAVEIPDDAPIELSEDVVEAVQTAELPEKIEEKEEKIEVKPLKPVENTYRPARKKR